MNEDRTPYGVELGRWLRQRRDALSMTQEQVWARMELDSGESNYITQLEGGRRKNLPDVDILIGLAQALRTSVTEVLRGAGVLPVDVEESTEHAPGSQTIHSLVDSIDWTRDPTNRDNVEGLLRFIRDRQGASSDSTDRPVLDRA